MAEIFTPTMAIPLILILTNFALTNFAFASATPISFSFDHFPKNVTFDSSIALYGDAVLQDSTVRMIAGGKLLYKKPFNFSWGKGNPSAFSTYFCFSIPSSGANNLAFFIDSADPRLSKNLLLVEFASNASVGHIGIRVAHESCNFSLNDDMLSSGGGKVHSWVEYDGFSKRVEVRLSKIRAWRPANPFISCPVDISSVLQMESLLVGLSSSTDYSTWTERNSSQGSFIYSWSFLVKLGVPFRMHSEPLDPRAYLVASEDGSKVHQRNGYGRANNVMAWLFGLVCGAFMAFMLVFVRNVICCRRPVGAVDCPVHPVEVGYEEAVMEKDAKTAPT